MRLQPTGRTPMKMMMNYNCNKNTPMTVIDYMYNMFDTIKCILYSLSIEPKEEKDEELNLADLKYEIFSNENLKMSKIKKQKIQKNTKKHKKQKNIKNSKTTKKCLKEKILKKPKNDKMKNKKKYKRKMKMKTERRWGLRLLFWLISMDLNPQCTGNMGVRNESRDYNEKCDQLTRIILQTFTKSPSKSLLGTTELDYRPTGGTLGRMDWESCTWRNDIMICSKMKLFSISNKTRNRRKKMENGNGIIRQNMTLIHWNMGSKMWTRKREEIEAVITQYTPDVLVISESNLLESLENYEKEIQGYQLLLPKTTEVQTISRLVMLIKNGIEVKIMDNLMDASLASIWIKVGARGRRPMLVGTIYREHQFLYQQDPNQSGSPQQQTARWAKFVDKWKAAAGHGDVIVLGDVNLDFFKWGNPDSGHKKMVDKVKEEVETLGFNQIIQGFTRTWPGVPDSLVDHCWMNCQNRLIYHRNIVRTFSDHNLLIVSFRTKTKNLDRHDIIKRERKGMDPIQYKNEIAKIDWTDLYAATDIDIINSIFEEKVLGVLDMMAPVKAFQMRSKFRSWISEDVRNEMLERDRLREVARVSKNDADWSAYRVARNKCVKSLVRSKVDHYKDIYTSIEKEHDMKRLYRLTGELSGKVSCNTPQQLVDNDGILTRKPVEMANLLIKFYEDKIIKLMRKIKISARNPHRFLDAALQKWDGRENVPTFQFGPISLIETEKLISEMGKSSVLGHDQIDSLGIKDAGKELAGPIQHIINSSLKNRKFATKWKLARLTPILKGTDLNRSSVSSYRPVAVLPTISKLVERVAQRQLLGFLQSTSQLNPSAHAYRPSHSTTTTLCEILDAVYQGAEDRQMTSLMALDLSSAFDTVSHSLLLQKLEKYRVGLEAREWIQSYLQYRSQYVVLGRAKSNIQAVSRGVPQGSVIGPLFYAIFTNDMTEIIKNKNCKNQSHGDKKDLFGRQCRECGHLTLYADDSTFTIGNKDRTRNQLILRRNLDEINLYLSDNQLALNQSKTSLTEMMVAQKKGKTSGQPPSLLVDTDTGTQKLIQDKTSTRILGSNVQSNILWNSHLEEGPKALFPQVRKLLGQLKHCGKLIPKESRTNLARGLILGRLSYLLPLWGSTSSTNLRRAQIIVNNAARWASGLGRRTRISTLMKAVDWMTVKELVMMSTLTLTWKLVHQGLPLRLSENMQVTDDCKIITGDARLLLCKDAFRWRAARTWNELEHSIRNEKSIAKFKRLVRVKIKSQRDARPPD